MARKTTNSSGTKTGAGKTGAAKTGAAKTRASKEPARPARPRPAAASLTEQAYEAIKEKVITLYFLPGQYLNEQAICELLNLGRTPVHQALQRLQVEGLVDIVPRKGVIIQPDSIGQIIEILDARLVVETEIARKAAEKAEAPDVEALQAILDHHSSGQHGGGAIDAFVECDRAFHVKISEMSRNHVLGDFAKVLHERSTRSWYLHLWQTLDTTASDRQHRGVLAAIRARDGEAAAGAMREHLMSLRERVAHLQQTAPRRGLGHGH
ncbi:MAG: GntR family transcriptional regulator [Rhizobiales bacterium]|nr:GntR family transcriptional regulator [Hyphomicrobiales bacterium]